MGIVQKPNKLYIWRDRSLFLSSGPIESHVYKTAFHKLVVSLDKDIQIRLDNGLVVSTRSYLVKAGTRLLDGLTEDDSEKAVYYLPTMAQDYYALASVMTPSHSGVYHDHPNYDDLVSALSDIQNGNYDCSDALATLNPLIIPPSLEGKIFVEIDPRILEVIDLIESAFLENLSIAELAEQVCLSASRLEKLFKEQVGIPITTYRIRFRVFLGVIHLCMGASVTDSALGSGFSNLAHFSRSFAAVNGIQPTAIFANPGALDMYLANEIFEDPILRNGTLKEHLSRQQKCGNSHQSVVRFL